MFFVVTLLVGLAVAGPLIENIPQRNIKRASVATPVVAPRATKVNDMNLENIEKIKEDIPVTYEEVEKLIEEETAEDAISGIEGVPRCQGNKCWPKRGKFILWTHDGEHVMWGKYGARYFVGTDNEGKRAWGIYGKEFFAGFYDGEFFYGSYRGRRWKAHNLFGEEFSRGNYVLFPEKISYYKPTPYLTMEKYSGDESNE